MARGGERGCRLSGCVGALPGPRPRPIPSARLTERPQPRPASHAGPWTGARDRKGVSGGGAAPVSRCGPAQLPAPSSTSRFGPPGTALALSAPARARRHALSLSFFSPHTCRCPPCIRPSCPARPWRRAENESGWRVDERAAEAGGRACFPPLSLSLVSPWACPPALPGPLLHQPRQSRFGRRHRATRGRGRRGVAAGTLPPQP